MIHAFLSMFGLYIVYAISDPIGFINSILELI